jgi:hypothetical protein
MSEPGAIVKSEAVELVPPVAVTLPGRYFHHARGQARSVSITQLRELGELFIKSAVAVTDLYLRICLHIRVYALDRDEVAPVLKGCGFPSSRVSELFRVAYAPENIFREFSATHIGFRVALVKTRMYYEVRRRDAGVRRRKVRRASARLLRLVADLGESTWEYRAKNYRLLVVAEQRITNIVRYKRDREPTTRLT